MSVRTLVYVVAALAALAVLVGTVTSLIEGAKLEAIHSVEKSNQASQDKAFRGQQDVDQCYRSGGTWNRSSGMCAK